MIIGMDVREPRLEARRHGAGDEPEDLIELVRPVEVVRSHVPFPDADVNESLKLSE